MVKRIILIIILVLSITMPVHSAEYSGTVYVTQSGTGDGTSYAQAISVATHNANTFAVDAIIYLCDTITTRVSPPSSGTGEDDRITYRGDYADHAGIIDGVDAGASDVGGLFIYGKDYITAGFGLTIKNTTQTSGHGHGIKITDSDYTIIDGAIIETNGYNGIYVTNGSTDWIIQNSTIQDNDQNGILTDDDAPEGGIIRYNTFDANGNYLADYCEQGDTSASWSHNIYIGKATASETEIYDNIIQNAWCGNGVKIKANANVHHNYIVNNEDSGIMHIEQNVTSVQKVHNNVIINGAGGRGLAPMAFWKEAEGDCTIIDYNNSIYFTDPWNSWGAGFLLDSDGGTGPNSLTFKNNIIYAPVGHWCVRMESDGVPVASDIDYNWCYVSEGDPISYGGSTRTWEYWQETLSFDTNGGNTDPGYTNPPTNLSLVEGANVIDQGVDLGDTYTNGLNPNASWPLSVSTLNQDSYGVGWEVGAYVYPTGEVEPGRVGTIAGDGSGSTPGGGSGSIVGSIVE